MVIWVVVAFAVGAAVGFVVGPLWVGVFRRSSESGHPDVGGGVARQTDHDVSVAMREALGHLETGVMIADSSGRITYRNPAAGAFSGTHVGVLVDDRVASLVAAAHAGAATSAVAEFQGPPRAWLEMSARLLPNGGAVTTIRDVSERMRTDVMRSDFVANVSHELRTPVGAVAVLAEALVDETDAQVVSRLAGRLVEEAHRAVETIDDLLILAEVESTQPADDVVDLDRVIARAIERGRGVDSANGVEIVVSSGHPGTRVRGDDQQLVSAVGNLVENAVKYSSPGDVVTVGVELDAASVVVAVTDHGIGIPVRDHDRIFERFYRVDRARSRDTGGTGLGLSIVRRVAINHGGEVALSSAEGEGSTFVLRLPARLVVENGGGADE